MARNVGINSTFEQQRLVINELAVDVEVLQSAGYISTFTESDPVFSASAASNITSGNISNWNAAYGWGDHSIVGYTTITGVGTDGSINTTGIITAASFYGSGANLTSLPAGQLTGALPAIDGSALTGVTATGSGVEVRDGGTPVGTASTIDFGANLSVSPVSAGVVTVTASGGGESYWVSTAGVGIHTTSNVGIGTTNPTSKLTVEGDGKFTGVVTATRFESSSAGTPTIDSPNNLNINAVTVAISTDLTVGGDAYVGVDTSSGLILTSPNGTQYRLVVDNAGTLSTVLVP